MMATSDLQLPPEVQEQIEQLEEELAEGEFQSFSRG